jgi:hypothetical protein
VSSARSLADSQARFIAELLAEAPPTGEGHCARHRAGMDIYRNAYRSRLVNAVRSSYERTVRWVGEDAFRQAAVHHVIVHPPGSWTLDAVGLGFADTLRELFPADPEVSELAWLEWAMHGCFVAADDTPMDVARFQAATAGFLDADWSNMRLRMLPGTAVSEISRDIAGLWQGLAPAATGQALPPVQVMQSCVVWREGLQPVFATVGRAEGSALSTLLDGGNYGEACEALIEMLGEAAAVSEAGLMLGRWLHNGMIAEVI